MTSNADLSNSMLRHLCRPAASRLVRGGVGSSRVLSPRLLSPPHAHLSTLPPKIVSPPMVYIRGEEMTRYCLDLILEQWIEPHVDTAAWEF